MRATVDIIDSRTYLSSVISLGASNFSHLRIRLRQGSNHPSKTQDSRTLLGDKPDLTIGIKLNKFKGQ